MSTEALKIRQLNVNYDKTPVLWDISLDVPSGQLVGIIGPNGAGKSTLIKAALGLVKPISGKITFFDKPLKEVRLQVSYVPQRESVDWDFPITVKDLVMMGRYGKLGILQWPKKKDYELVDYYLDMVGILQYGDRQISQLSGGQQQRAFLARALVQEADIYFMDEPFVGVDIATETILMNVMRGLREKGKTIFVVHHDLNTVESYFDWVIMLNMRLVANGKTKEVFNAQTLMSTYGKNFNLLDEALRLSQSKASGIL